MKQREVKVLIADDHPVFRRGLRLIIEANPHFRVVGEAADGEAALRLIADLKPAIAVVDIEMPRLNGLEVARALQKMGSPVALLFLTMYNEEDLFNAAMDLGVKAYVLKDSAPEDILAAMEKVVRGETFFSRSIAAMGRRRSSRVRKLLLSKPQIEELTLAERRILKFIAQDRTSKEIADLLDISVKTVENHRLNICHKLNLHGSHSLLKFAFDLKAYL